MTPQHLKYVLTLAEEKNFSKAAQKLFITQPSLSQFIKNLESQLNVQLFDRSTAPIRLTYAGEIYVDAAHKIQAVQTELDNQLTDLHNLNLGELRIGTTPFRASCLLPKSIGAFRQKHPRVNIHIVEDKESALESMLSEGNLDMCILAGPLDANLFHSEPLAEELLYLAVPPNSPFHNGKEDCRITVEDILMNSRRLFRANPIDLSLCAQESFIFLQQDRNFQQLEHALSQLPEFKPDIVMHTERIETSFAWTLSGIACCCIPDTFIRFGNHQRHPIYYKLNSALAQRDIVVAFKKNRYLSRAASNYVLILKQLIGQGTWKPPG
ncbi:LysR substrate-binding domain-containing protein [Cohnella suwonensis]|uniref:LysR substrate-binding domain-containing protein n=1 Tax=Cohnella suwonensis TaxID=696072 RepID=A0ABW0M172_9BACL